MLSWVISQAFGACLWAILPLAHYSWSISPIRKSACTSLIAMRDADLEGVVVESSDQYASTALETSSRTRSNAWQSARLSSGFLMTRSGSPIASSRSWIWRRRASLAWRSAGGRMRCANPATNQDAPRSRTTVPDEVSESYAEHTKSGQVRVDGRNSM